METRARQRIRVGTIVGMHIYDLSSENHATSSGGMALGRVTKKGVDACSVRIFHPVFRCGKRGSVYLKKLITLPRKIDIQWLSGQQRDLILSLIERIYWLEFKLRDLEFASGMKRRRT